MQLFIGINKLMGLIRKPAIKDYWSNHKLIETPGIKELMSRDRFWQIRKYFTTYDIDKI